MSYSNIEIKNVKSIFESETINNEIFNKHLNTAWKRIENGDDPEDVFNIDGYWHLGGIRVELDGRYNWLWMTRDGYSLLSDEWYIDMAQRFYYGWLKVSKYFEDDDTELINFINDNGEYLSKEWFVKATNFDANGNAVVEYDGKYIDIFDNNGNSKLDQYGTDWKCVWGDVFIGGNSIISSYNDGNEKFILLNDNNIVTISGECEFDDYEVLKTEDNNRFVVLTYITYRTHKNVTYLYDTEHKTVVFSNIPFQRIKELNDNYGLFLGETDNGIVVLQLNENEPIISDYYDDVDDISYYHYIPVRNYDGYYILDFKTLKPIIDTPYDEIIEHDSFILGEKNSKQFVILHTGELFDKNGFDNIKEDNYDPGLVIVERNGMWNIISFYNNNARYLLQTWSSTEPSGPYYDNNEFEDYFIVTIDNKKCKLVSKPNNNYELVKESMEQNIDEEISPDDIDLSSFDIKDKLCPDLWENEKLKPLARRTLLQIAKDFIEHLEIGDEVEDITVTGSLANYNWDEDYSDVDLHIIMDFQYISDDPEILKKFFDAERKSWNKEHNNITIYGYPVEIYIQDINEEHHSSGVYSILTDEWLTRPSKNYFKQYDTDYHNVQDATSSLMNKIDNLENRLNNNDGVENVYVQASTLFDKIKDIRKSGMGTDTPEMSDGNLIFKSLRRSGYIEKLLDIRTKAFDMIHSI